MEATTPFLQRIGSEEEEDDDLNWKKGFIEEVKKQLWLAGPLVSVNLLTFCLQLVSIMFVGHLDELSLSGACMATSFSSVTGFSLLMGMASALDTFCGQSYGAKRYDRLGIHLQRAMLVLTLVSIPLAIIWAYSKSILIAFGQEPAIATEAGRYAQFLIPSLFANGILQCLIRFLQAQNIVFPMMVTTGISTLVHLPLCWVLVFKSGLGHRGAALSSGISYSINAILLGLYIKFSSSCAKTWTGFSSEAFHQLFAFIRLSIPSALMVCLEAWSFEFMVLSAGLLPNPVLETSVLSISLNTAATVWMISFGLGAAVSTRVSNELGAGRPRIAKLAVSAVLFLALTESVVIGVLLVSLRNILGYAFSNEEEVIRYLAIMLPLLAVSNLLDSTQAALSGVARGCGWQKIGAFINLGSYYIVGIPLAVVFAFVLHIGGKGLWLGIIVALVVQVVTFLFITLRTDWDQQAIKATKMVNESSNSAETVA